MQSFNLLMKRCILLLFTAVLLPGTQAGTIVIGGVPYGTSSDYVLSWKPTFEEYLSIEVGTKHNPPLNFSFITLTLSSAFNKIKERALDFIYTNPSLYSCLEVEESGGRFQIYFLQNIGMTFINCSASDRYSAK